MSTIEQSVDVEVPVRNAYNQWTQFEEFPSLHGGCGTGRAGHGHETSLGSPGRRRAS